MDVKKIKNAVIIVNMLKDTAKEVVDDICCYLDKKGIKTRTFAYMGRPIEPDVGNADIAFALGGDGTVLFCSRVLAEKKIPVLAVNVGNFGFITEVSKTEWKDAYEDYVLGKLRLSKRLMLRVCIFRDEKLIAEYSALNDAVISSYGISKIIRLVVEVDETKLGKYRADGIIISTPTGSTAYSAAAGGPVIEPEMDAMLINPICPFSLSNRPLLISSDKRIRVSVESEQRANLILTIDGQSVFHLQASDNVFITRAREKAMIISSDKRNFYEILRKKLKWSGGSDA